MNEKRKWTGLICPVCRFVMRVPSGHADEGAVCPSCKSVFNIPRLNQPIVSECVKSDTLIDEGLERSGAERRVYRFSVAASIALGIVAVSILLSSMFRGKGDVERGAELLGVGVSEEEVVSPISDEDLVVSQRAKVDEVKKFAIKFFLEEDAAIREAMVRHPETTVPRMREYYKKQPFETEDYSYIAAGVTVDSETGVSRFKLPSGMVVITDTEDGYLLDWESLVGWSEMSLNTFLSKKPLKETRMRVVSKQAAYYAGDYSDEEKWLCLRLETFDSNEFVYGYIAQDIMSEIDLGILFLNKSFLRMIVNIRFVEGATSHNQVLISEMIQEDWFDAGGETNE